MKAGPDNGKSVEGDKLDVFVKWDGQDEIPFRDIIKCTEDYTMDLRFGGNIESAKENNTGCVLCLDSCATGMRAMLHGLLEPHRMMLPSFMGIRMSAGGWYSGNRCFPSGKVTD
ncbi:MAG: hypothetical protein ACLVD8_06430 [Enterocloster sp.]|uniref:hypothetical protein n=1 Tax=Enterocloster sp. TaxID=2719315 RepID=UPI00399B4598